MQFTANGPVLAMAFTAKSLLVQPQEKDDNGSQAAKLWFYVPVAGKSVGGVWSGAATQRPC